MQVKPKNILVVRTDRVGDVVLTLPVFPVLRKNFPDSRITVLVAESTRALVEGHPDIDEVISINRDSKFKGWGRFWKLVLKLRSRSFDWAILFHTKKWTNVLCFFAGIPRRTGYKNEKFGRLLTEPVFDERNLGRKHESEFCLDLLKKIGLDVPDEMVFVVPHHPSAGSWLKNWTSKINTPLEKTIIINPSASDPARRWPPESFAALLKKLAEHGYGPLIIVGTKSDKAALRLREMTHGISADLIGQTNMSQFIELLRHSRMLISNDSGPVHIAAALQKPVVSIFIRDEPGVNPERWRPLGEKSRIVVTPYKFDSSRPGEKAPMRPADAGISVETVFEAVDALLKLC